MDKYPLDANLLVTEYQRRLNDVIKECVTQQAIINQLQMELQEAKKNKGEKEKTS